MAKKSPIVRAARYPNLHERQYLFKDAKAGIGIAAVTEASPRWSISCRTDGTPANISSLTMAARNTAYCGMVCIAGVLTRMGTPSRPTRTSLKRLN